MTIDLAQEAHRLNSDLTRARPAVFWSDFLLTLLLVYGGLAAAVQGEGAVRLIGAALCVYAVYRGLSFIHEITHLRPRDVPGFKFVWNATFGVIFLVPSFMYEYVHNLHHNKRRYGTINDPEYLPLSHGGASSVVIFILVAALAPLGAFIRFAILTPLSFFIPPLRRAVFARYSALTINPAFRREDFVNMKKPAWVAQEVAAWLWSWTLAAIVVSGGLGARYVLTAVVLLSAAALINQARTLVAHAWVGRGEQMTFTEQLLDSINVPPPNWMSLLWAPVGLRYHALHHLLPGVPYHNLAEAHRRLIAGLPPESEYHRVQLRGFWTACSALMARISTGKAGSTPDHAL